MPARLSTLTLSVSNYGIILLVMQQRCLAPAWFVVHDVCCRQATGHQKQSLPEFLRRENGVVAIEGIPAAAARPCTCATMAHEAVITERTTDPAHLLARPGVCCLERSPRRLRRRASRGSRYVKRFSGALSHTTVAKNGILQESFRSETAARSRRCTVEHC